MQAIFIQQDSIVELHEAVTGNSRDTRDFKSWQSLRQLRNTCAGHPAKKERPKTTPVTRTFMGRSFGDYSSFSYEQWARGAGISHPKVALGSLIDDYATEAESELDAILQFMKAKWP